MTETIDLPTQFSKEVLQGIIENELKTDQFILKVEYGSSKGDNYMGVLYRVIATRKCKSPKNKNEISLIVKLAPLSEARREQYYSRICFIRESLVYDEILPMFDQFQNKKGILPEEHGFYHYPHCFKSVTTDKKELLIFEDLKLLNFEMYKRNKDVTFEIAKLVMEGLGKLHALSLAIKDQECESIKKFTNMESVFKTREKDEQFNEFVIKSKKRAITTLDKESDEMLIKKLDKIFETKYIDILMDCLNGKKSEPYSVITHGDCWTNNILFRYKDNIPIELRFLDWQLSGYASPVCDLSYYIFNNLTKKLRDLHYHDLINIYYNSLSTFLTLLGSDSEKCFPRHILQQQLVSNGKYGLLLAIFLLPIFTSDVEDIPDLDELSDKMKESGTFDLNFNSESTIHIYNERMSDIIRDMFNLGYL